MEIREAITGFIVAEFLPQTAAAELPADLNLLDAGIVDSLGLLKVIAYLEEQLRISVPPEAMVPENFASVQAIVELVRSCERGAA
jgi:acyl carrier protein